MAYDFSGKERDLTVGDIDRPDFQEWFRGFEQGLARLSDGKLTHSTGTLMKEMVLRGPSQYDGLILYENLAIEYLKPAQEHWGELYVAYPEPNLWNEHPYYILDVPWSDAPHRKVAEEFLEFLLSEPIQRKALDSGFRPGLPSVPVKFPTSPLVENDRSGVKINVPRLAEPPKADVVNHLLGLSRQLEP